LIFFVFAILAAAGPLRAGVSMGTIEEDPEVRKAMIRQKVEENYKEGMKARAAGNLADAVKFLIWAATTRCDTQFPELAFNELKAISDDAKKELEVARQLVSGEDPAAGLGELKRIARIYFGLGVAKDAGALARQLESDPAFQVRMKAGRLLEELKKAEALEAQAESLLRPPGVPPPAATPTKPPQTPAKPPQVPPPAAPVKPAAEEVPASPPPAPQAPGAPAAAGPVNVAPWAPKPPGAAAAAPPAAAPEQPPAAGSETSAAPSPKSPWEEILRDMPPAPPPVGPPKPAPEKAGPAPLPPRPPEPPKPPGIITASVKPKEMTEAERRLARMELLMQAYDIYCRVAQQGAGTEPGKKAAEAKARLEKDADLMACVKAAETDRKARAMMSLADGYFRAGRFDLARRYYAQIISEFPQSQQAAGARAVLERLK
jgi:tetratricopeptide (TPR) repeat protein